MKLLDKKNWQAIPIQDCAEPLDTLPAEIARVEPHPYLALGAAYPDSTPHCLRRSVLQRLIRVHEALQRRHPGWRLRVFDAYRPNAVQQFMVDHTYATMRAQTPHASEAQIWERVYTFWAQPSDDPATPPPHSTGAAIDLTLENAAGEELDMGTPIDDFSARAHPDFFRDQPQHAYIQARRTLLFDLMHAEGFVQHPAEWWHFSYGDQLWAWRHGAAQAHYGRADLI